MNSNQSQHFKLSFTKFIPGIAWFFLILILICMPSSRLPEVDDWMIVINYDKLIHVGVFAILAFLFMYPISKADLDSKVKWHYMIKIAIATIIWGITTELIQKFFIPSRSFSLSDWLADGIGGILALFYAKFWMLKRTEPKN